MPNNFQLHLMFFITGLAVAVLIGDFIWGGALECVRII